MATQLGLFKRLTTIDSILSRSQKPTPRRRQPVAKTPLTPRHYASEGQVTLPFPQHLFQYSWQTTTFPQAVLNGNVSFQKLVAARDHNNLDNLNYDDLKAYISWLAHIDSKDIKELQDVAAQDQPLPTDRKTVHPTRTIDWPIVEWDKTFNARPPHYYLPWRISAPRQDFVYPHVTYLNHPQFLYDQNGIHFFVPEDKDTNTPSQKISISANTTWDDLKKIEQAFMDSDLVSVIKCSTRLGVTKRIFIRVPSGEMKEVLRVHKRWPGHSEFSPKGNYPSINAPTIQYELLDPRERPLMIWSFNQGNLLSNFWESEFREQSPELNLYQSYGITYIPQERTLNIHSIKIADLMKDKKSFMRLCGSLVGRNNAHSKKWKAFKAEMKELEKKKHLTSDDYTRFVFKKDGIEFDLVFGLTGLQVTVTVNGLMFDFTFWKNQLVQFNGYHYLDPELYPAVLHPDKTSAGLRKIRMGRHELTVTIHQTAYGLDLEDLLIGELYSMNRMTQAQINTEFIRAFGEVDDLPKRAELEELPNGMAILFGMNWGWSLQPSDAEIDDTVSVSKFATMHLPNPSLGAGRHLGLSSESARQFQLSSTQSNPQDSRYPKNYISLDEYGLDVDYIPGREIKRPGQDHSPKTLAQFVDFLNELCQESPYIAYQVISNDEDEFAIEMFLFDEEHGKWTYASTFNFDSNGTQYGAYQDIYSAKALMNETDHRYFGMQRSELHPDTLDNIHFSFLQNRRYQDKRQTRQFVEQTFMTFWKKLCQDNGPTGFFGSISGENLLLYQSEFIVFHYTPEVLPLMLKVIHHPHKLTFDDIKTLQSHFVTTAYGQPHYFEDEDDDPDFNPFISILPQNQKARAVALAENMRMQLGNHSEGFAVIVDMSHVYHEPPTDPDDNDENSEDEESSDDVSDSPGLQVTPTQSLPAA